MELYLYNYSGVRENLGNWIRKLECAGDVEKQWHHKRNFINRLQHSDIAILTDKANEQHYEVPTQFYKIVCFFLFLCEILVTRTYYTFPSITLLYL